MTASAHVLVFRPLIGLLRARGNEVEITAREYAQTLQLLELHDLEATVVGRHGGRSRLGKARSLASRLRALHKWAGPRNFDLALAHGSHELTLSARRLGIPSATTHDYEFAKLQHQLGMRAATKVVLPRTEEQREFVRGLDLSSMIVPDRAVDAQSLIALADLVVSAGGTMNREAAALGVPVYTTYGGRLGGVDEELIRQGRLKPLTDPRALELRKREGVDGARVRRDPAEMLALLLSPVRD